jgi:dihydrofolate reductase
VKVRNAADTACENHCAKWYGTLENGFKDPKDDDSNVAIYGGSAVYCQYLLWTSIPIKSDEC